MPAGAREALIDLLQTDAFARPTAVTGPPTAEDRERLGFVRTSFERGMLLLEDRHGDFYRASWGELQGKEGEDGDDGVRAVPPGVYRLAAYRVLCDDESGRQWFISVTNPHYRNVTIRMGRTTLVDIDDRILLRLTAQRGDRGFLRIGVSIMSPHHGGLSVYCGGTRIPIEYVVHDAQGDELASGPLRYG